MVKPQAVLYLYLPQLKKPFDVFFFLGDHNQLSIIINNLFNLKKFKLKINHIKYDKSLIKKLGFKRKQLFYVQNYS